MSNSSPACLSATESQHPSQQTKEKDTEIDIKEANNSNATVSSVQSRTSLSVEQGGTGFLLTIYNILKQVPSWISRNTKDCKETSTENHRDPDSTLPSKALQIQDSTRENSDDHVDPSKSPTAMLVVNAVKPVEPFQEEKENVKELQRESSISNGNDSYLRDELEKVKNHVVYLQNKFAQMELRIQHLEKQPKGVTEHFESFKTNTKSGRNDIMEKKKKGESKSPHSDYSKEIEVVCQLYCPNPSDMVTSVTEALSVRLTSHRSTKDLKLKIKICNSAQEINNDLPLILICLQASRLGTDISNAIKGLEIGRNVAVLILHYADIHALPKLSSRKLLTSAEYKEIYTMIDMGFLSEKGIYVCDMNERALNDLTLFLKQSV